MAKKDRVKGITIEIGGDAQKLSKALEGVNKDISHTQSQLKDVNELLKLDPTNMKLLEQKSELAGESIKKTKEKLKALKEAEKQVQEQFKQGKVSEEAYRSLQREIEATEISLKNLEKQTGATYTAIGNKVKGVGSSIKGAGKAMMPVTAGVVGAGAAGLKVAADFEAGMSKVKAVTGATDKEFEALRQKAIELGASTSFSSEEVADAMTEMAKAGWSSQQIIDGMGGVLSATAASGEQLGSVSTIVADAITGFGLAAGDSARVADLLTQAANGGTIGINDLGESYKYIAPLAQSTGYSIEEITTALMAMSKSGIKGSQAGTSLRTTLTNMIRPTDNMAIAMEELGIEIANEDGTFKSFDELLGIMRGSFSGLTDEQKAYYASVIAGKEGQSGLLSLLNMTQTEYDELTASMTHCKGVADETAAVMQDNLKAKVEQLGGALESLAIVFADNVLPLITDGVEAVTGWIEKFSQLDEGHQKLILIIFGVIAAIGPLLMAIGQVTMGIGGIIQIIPTLSKGFEFISTTALPKLGNAFSSTIKFITSNPIVLLIAAIVGLVVLIATKGDEIQALLKKLDDWLQNVFAKDWTEVFGPVLGGILNGFFVFLKGFGDNTKKIFDGINDFIRGAFTGDWERAWEGVKEIFKGVFDSLVDIAQAPFNAINGMINGVLDGIDWIIEGFNDLTGLDVPTFDFDLPMLADGGVVTHGSAIVGEAGPELLTVQNGRAVVQPLGGRGQTVVHQTNHFNNYKPRDGAAAVRDLNRQLGWEY